MKVAVISTVILEVPEAPIELIRSQLYASNVFAIGREWITVSEVPYRFLKIESFKVERREQ